VDFEAIVWGQATWEDEAAERANRVLVCDTELHTTCTWSDMIIGTCPEWLRRVARDRRYDLMIMLDAEGVPWVSDGTRVLENALVEHAARIRAELDAAGREYVVLRGTFEERRREAERLVRALLATPVTTP